MIRKRSFSGNGFPFPAGNQGGKYRNENKTSYLNLKSGQVSGRVEKS